MKIIHYWKVARHFRMSQRAFWIALLHDSIEDGWARPWMFRWLPEVIDLTRSPGEPYDAYITRLQSSPFPIVLQVKIADLVENHKRAWPSLRRRYEKAHLILTGLGIARH